MKGIVISKGEKYFTFLKSIFDAMGGIQTEYNWLITAHECYPQKPDYAEILSGKYCLITGEEFTKMIYDENFQWIWGVISAFPKNITKENIFKYPLPRAEGNNRIFQNPITIQHPLSEIEIIAWDSSMTIFIGKNHEIVEKIIAATINEDLEEYNKKF